MFDKRVFLAHRYHRSEDQTLKNRILVKNYFLLGDHETQIKTFADHYDHERHTSEVGLLAPQVYVPADMSADVRGEYG